MNPSLPYRMNALKTIACAGVIASLATTPSSVFAQLITQAPPPPPEAPLALDDAPSPPSPDLVDDENQVIISAPETEPSDLLTPPPPPVDPAPVVPDVLAPPAPPAPLAPTPITPPAPMQETPQLPTPSVPDAPPPPTAPDSGTDAPSLTVAPTTPRTFEFQQEDVPTVLRLLARQAGVNLVVSDLVSGLITMRLQDVTALQAINVIVTAKALSMDLIDGVYYVKTAGEKAAEPTESQSYTFSFARAETVVALLAGQLQSKSSPPQVDPRTNTIFYREAISNLDAIKQFLAQIDRPTKQVMIESRLVETAANPQQSYGINWSGVVGSADRPQVFRFGGTLQDDQGNQEVLAAPGGGIGMADFIRSASSFAPFAGQIAVLSAPQLSLALTFLNEDSDAEFLANPRIVTADNQEATIRIITQRPVPSLNFNEQTATAEFGGFDIYEFGTTLVVRPSVNKDNFITLSVRPEVSNSSRDVDFQFVGTSVSAPVIELRTLESNVMIPSGHTLAIGGLLQDQTVSARSKVPIAGDIPILGYLFQDRSTSRQKRNLLIFITPTVINPHVGTGLEDQVYGLRYSGEEFADPNGWLNNARGVYRLVPTEERSIASEYPVGAPSAPSFQRSAPFRE